MTHWFHRPTCTYLSLASHLNQYSIHLKKKDTKRSRNVMRLISRSWLEEILLNTTKNIAQTLDGITVEPPVSGHPRDRGLVSVYGRCPPTGGWEKSYTRGHIMHQNKHFKTLRPFVTVLFIKGLLDVAFLLYCTYIYCKFNTNLNTMGQ